LISGSTGQDVALRRKSLRCTLENNKNRIRTAHYIGKTNMVSTLAIISMVFSLLVIFLFPIGLAVWLRVRHRASLLAVLVGAVIFLVFQLLTRIPLLNALSGTEWYMRMVAQPVLIALFLSFTAGLFEEVGRWLGFRYLLRGRWKIKDGVAYGVGHGGFEAIILVGLTYINNIVISLMINSGQYDQLIAPSLGPASEGIRQQMTELPPLIFTTAGIERFLVIIIHIGLSLVVLQGVRQGRPVYILYAILLHTLVNLPAVLIPAFGYSMYWSLIYLAVLAGIAFIYIRRLWVAEQQNEETRLPIEAAGE
jgi:uncharacterized membrane protein YhfC